MSLYKFRKALIELDPIRVDDVIYKNINAIKNRLNIHQSLKLEERVNIDKHQIAELVKNKIFTKKGNFKITRRYTFVANDLDKSHPECRKASLEFKLRDTGLEDWQKERFKKLVSTRYNDGIVRLTSHRYPFWEQNMADIRQIYDRLISESKKKTSVVLKKNKRDVVELIKRDKVKMSWLFE